MLYGMVVYYASFLHNQNFDTSQCNHNSGNGDGNTGSGASGGDTGKESCCGFYPERAPFNVGNGRKCCSFDQVLFSDLVSICCDDGVHDIGNPC